MRVRVRAHVRVFGAKKKNSEDWVQVGSSYECYFNRYDLDTATWEINKHNVTTLRVRTACDKRIISDRFFVLESS